METTRKVAPLSPRSIQRAAICLRLSECVCVYVGQIVSVCLLLSFISVNVKVCLRVCVCVQEIDECVYTKTMHGWFSV